MPMKNTTKTPGKPGRPRKPDDQRLAVYYSIRVTIAQAEKLKRIGPDRHRAMVDRARA
jgi:hypothetical protein